MNPNAPSQFPTDFIWGAAAASYQIEGAITEDGRGESIWDRFSATPGKVRNGDTGEIACDFYHRYPQDIELMRELGLDAFRFSIAWPRVVPDGRGAVNEKGLDFYDRLVDELLAQDIRPFATLYHWDLPQALEDRGGWPARDTVEAYVEYVEAVVARLGDRVSDWTTHNEPRVVAWQGYGLGVHAPGRTSERDALATAHHLLLSHGRAVEILRREVPGAQVGITLDLWPYYPASPSEEDIDAARHLDGFHNRWFLDPIFHGHYPEDLLEHFGASAPTVEPGDFETISAPIDFLGVNNYSRHVIQANPDGGEPIHLRDPASQYTDMEWEVYPDGLRNMLLRIRDDYGPRAIYITENGASFPDVRVHDGQVRDPERQAYLEGYLAAIGRAIEAGAPVKGYFVWTFLDNFEWGWGYWKRFGIVYVDFPTLERVPKGSYYWYRDFIAGQRESRGPDGPRPELTGAPASV
jgi:beta-glucosidase